MQGHGGARRAGDPLWGRRAVAERAVWRRSPHDPRSGWGWALSERERQLRPARGGLGCLALAGAAGLLFAGHAGVAFGLVAVWLALGLVRPRPRPIEPLLTLPPPATAYPCDVDVLRDDVVIGTDRGFVTFLDGWLHFEGFRTTFSLSRADARGRQKNRVELVKGGVEFRPNGPASPFSSALDRWYRIDSAARGISVLPPQDVHPSGVAHAWADAALGAGQFALGCGAYAAAQGLFHVHVWFLFFLGGPSALFNAVRSLRALHRLRRADRQGLANGTAAPLGP